MIDQDGYIMTFSDKMTHTLNAITPQSGWVLDPKGNKQSLIFIMLSRNIGIWGKVIINDNCVIEDNIRIGHPNPHKFSQAI